MSKLRVLSLFSGVGAFEKALVNIGIDYELAGYSEIDKWAIQSYCAIHDVDKSLNLGDVSKIHKSKLPYADLITYGFPCQDVSLAGRGEGINHTTRSGLLFEAEEIIKEVSPKFAIAENVRGLISKRHRSDFESLIERLDGYGYNNYWSVLNAKDFGVPQNRERVFIVSIRKDIDDGNFEFPTGKNEELSLRDILEDEVGEKYYIENDETKNLLERLGKPKSDEKSIVASRGRYIKGNSGQTKQNLEINNSGSTNTITTVHKDNWVLEPRVLRYVRTDYGKRIRQKYESGEVEEKIGNMRKLSPRKDSLTNTLTTVHKDNYLLSGYRVRRLTPLEYWRLMGFEKNDYEQAKKRLEVEFYNGADRSDSQMYKQAANSIVVDVLEELFKKLLL